MIMHSVPASWLYAIDRTTFPDDDPIDCDGVSYSAIAYEPDPYVATAIGFVAYLDCGEGKWALVRYGVHPAWRGIGIGRAILGHRPPGAKMIETYSIENGPSELAMTAAGYQWYGVATCEDGREAKLWRWAKK